MEAILRGGAEGKSLIHPVKIVISVVLIGLFFLAVYLAYKHPPHSFLTNISYGIWLVITVLLGIAAALSAFKL